MCFRGGSLLVFIVLSHNNQSRSHSYSLSHHEMYTSRQCRALRARHVQIDEDLIGPAADTYFNRYAVGWLLLSAADLTRPCVCVRHAQKINAVSVCVWRERTGRVVIACTTHILDIAPPASPSPPPFPAAVGGDIRRLAMRRAAAEQRLRRRWAVVMATARPRPSNPWIASIDVGAVVVASRPRTYQTDGPQARRLCMVWRCRGRH